MVDIKQNIAKNIADLRKAAGLTQSELAEQLHYSDKAVSKWERGESVPDIAVLKEVADRFGVTIDYLVAADHKTSAGLPAFDAKQREHRSIAGLGMALVWLVATAVFVVLELALPTLQHPWLAFVYALPATAIVWLIFNTLWFVPRRNYLIISLLMWWVLASVYLTFLVCGHQYWLLFALGVPGQMIVWLWARMRAKKDSTNQ